MNFTASSSVNKSTAKMRLQEGFTKLKVIMDRTDIKIICNDVKLPASKTLLSCVLTSTSSMYFSEKFIPGSNRLTN